MAQTYHTIIKCCKNRINVFSCYHRISIKLSGLKLILLGYMKYLGKDIDKHLNRNKQIGEPCKKLSIANGIISKLRYDTPLNVCKRVYYVIFISHLINGSNSWTLTPSNKNIVRIKIFSFKMTITQR